MNKFKVYIPLIVGSCLAVGTFIGAKLNFQDGGEQIFAKNSKKDKLNRLIDYIDYEYVDQVNTDSIVDVTVNGILENLDPHSVYIPVDAYEDAANDMRGNFVGIGVNFYVYNDTIAIINPIEGGPAYEAGIRGGDRIVAADDQELNGAEISRDSIVSFLKGSRNSKVKLSIYRRGEPELLEFTVKRKEVPLVSVEASYLIDEVTGYVKINRFADTTYDEFKEAMDDLLDEGMETLILDLRNNPGGYINAANKILDEFLEDDKLMLITKNKKGDEDLTFATGRGDFEKGKVYVLMNENSASASEIVAGALQDNDHGTIVGRRSYGKGLVQREMSLGDGSAVRLTIARYYTPTGRSIQRSYAKGLDDYFSEYQNRYRNGELRSADSIKVSDSLKFVTPEGRVVYGGGGITPDVFVPKDTSIANETLEYVMSTGYMNYFVFEQLEDSREEFDGMDFDTFMNDYEVSDELANAFINYNERFKSPNLDLASHFDILKLAIKQTLADQLYGSNQARQVANGEDAMIQRVLDLERANLTPIED
ncbi:S41 family peptidase [Gilvibacter sp.]|uniref:S41 family peptidase n=2 Tax=Gilvibacter sp. TaxID=2729997 RepID=UPI0025BDF05C|nr:S41 family peptidase [Gilvibacter sp.]NQX77352.1 S41 family peptidase [Gilvibacter sp.]